MEFRNSIDTTGVDIPARIVDHVLAVAMQGPSSSVRLSATDVDAARDG